MSANEPSTMTDAERLDWLAQKLDPARNQPRESRSFVANFGNLFTVEIGRTSDSGVWFRLVIDEMRRLEEEDK